MASVNFYLKGAFAKQRLSEITDKKLVNEILDTRYQIFLKLSTSGERHQIYTKKRITQRLWNFEKQEADSNKMRKLGVAFNNWLKDLREDVMKMASENELSGKRTSKKDLQQILSTRFLNKPRSEEFEDQFKEFLSQHKTAAGHSLRPSSLQKYGGLKNHLKDYAKQSRQVLNIKNIDREFMQGFKDYLVEENKMNDNSVSKYIKILKPLLRYFMGKGVIQTFALTDVKSNVQDGAIFVLPIKNILELQNMEIEEEHLIQARNIFCFMCWTGQRYSDYQVIKWEDISLNDRNEKVWQLVTVKTHTAVTVPIIPYAEEILKRNKKMPTPFPRFTNQQMNIYLKKLGQMAKLNHTVKVADYYDGKKVEKFLPFHDVLTTHVARKSFITNSLILGVPERVIREVSGHRGEKSFRRYINLADNYKSDMISKAFSKKNIEQLLKDNEKTKTARPRKTAARKNSPKAKKVKRGKRKLN